ncbi:MAG TPA: NADP-dependent oxidoreductase [Chthoniobacterales bacterium]|jgi:NADPH:quinone reductase-like Zn-dependent oxidoreductase|nr:NADP-dependent oxidoreductase [Chthoniobacterales bacterium]
MRTAFCFIQLALALAVTSSITAESEAPTMKAVVLRSYGGPEVAKLEDVPRPEPKDDEILIRVIAASVNPVDVAIRKGYLAELIGNKFPLILGMDAAGVVEKAGAKITKFKKGDAVIAFFTLASEGGYAEYVIAKESEAAHKPKAVTYAQAAAVPAAGSTAWQALVDNAKLSTGQTVLIHGGSGGVGHFAIQIAKARGAKVIATGSTANQEFLKQMGADVAIDYTKTKFEDVAKDVDVVLDSVGRDTLKRSYGVVKKGGIIVSIVDEPVQAELDARGIRGVTLRSAPQAQVLEELARLIDAKKVTPVVSQTFPLSDFAKALDQIATRHTRGKIVFQVVPESDAKKTE